MSKLWKVEIPFDSSTHFPETLKTMILFFDKTIVRLPMIDKDTHFYNKNIWEEVLPDAYPLLFLKHFDYKYVGAFNELDFASGVIDMAAEAASSDCQKEYDPASDLNNYLEIMNMDHVDDFLSSCCPEDDDSAVKWTMKFSTLHLQQRAFQVSDLLSLLYSRKNAASGQMDVAELYNKMAKNYHLDMCEAFTSKQLLFPHYDNLSFSEGDRSIKNLLPLCAAEREEMKGELSGLMSGYYPDNKDKLHDYILQKVNPEVERFNSLLHDGKLAFIERLHQILGEPSGYTGITVSYFAGLAEHINHAAEAGDIDKDFKAPYLSDPVKRRKRPLFIRLTNT